jgi:hypothetical protein
MTLAASRPKRLAGGGPLERRVRQQPPVQLCAAFSASAFERSKPVMRGRLEPVGGDLDCEPERGGPSWDCWCSSGPASSTLRPSR